MADKIYELVNYMLAKKIRPDISLDKVTSLTESDVKKLKRKNKKKINKKENKKQK